MNADDISKVIIAIAVAFAIILLAVGLFRILNNLAGSVRDFRKTIKNLSSASDTILEDYMAVRSAIKSLISKLDGLKTILVPFSYLAKLKGLGKKESNSNKNKDKSDGQGIE